MPYRHSIRTALGVALLITLTTGLAAAQTPVTSVVIVDKAGVTTTNYPLTLSMIFKQGDVADHVYAKIGADTHHPDGHKGSLARRIGHACAGIVPDSEHAG